MPVPPARPIFDPSDFSDLPVSTRRAAVVAQVPTKGLRAERSGRAATPVANVLPSAMTLTIVLFGFDRVTTKACELVAVRLGVVHVAVRDLWATCKAMTRAPRAMVLASTTVAPWDRAVVDQRARAEQIPVHWLKDDGVEQTAQELRALLLAALRPSRR